LCEHALVTPFELVVPWFVEQVFASVSSLWSVFLSAILADPAAKPDYGATGLALESGCARLHPGLRTREGVAALASILSWWLSS